ncbi:CB1 cannabinoid receptor-interacting protein 1-like [Daphnia carinata]|uniref:CB1 cannabinoid receptor-interacting protein 1-like n=1 Tax=Daphnia carinata TaxID=120202 RepID=UPI00257CFAB7|nr:CB1 cannabinoid receptor-interacting protein 1-like [Daphnia carinata]
MGSFRVTLSLHKEPDNKPVFCKMDGQRFAQQRTVKFLADSKYRFDINIRPAKMVRGIAVMERALEVTDNSSKLEDENASSYSAFFQLDNLQPSKKGQRESVSLHVKMDGGYEFTTTLQIKIYNAKSTQHCDWGTTVHSIEYECHTDQQNNSIKIVKDTFR